MNRYFLSSKASRYVAIAVNVVLWSLDALIFFFLPISIGIKVALVVITLLLGILYLVLMMTTYLEINSFDQVLTYRFVQKSTLSLEVVHAVELKLNSLEQRETISFILKDANGKLLAEIPSFLTKKHQIQADQIKLAIETAL
jgi:hypothetical protein